MALPPCVVVIDAAWRLTHGTCRPPPTHRLTDEFGTAARRSMGMSTQTAPVLRSSGHERDRRRRRFHRRRPRRTVASSTSAPTGCSATFDEAEDAVQETYLRAWRSRDSFDGSAALRAWLYKIATNVCLDAIRRSNRRPPGRSLDSISEVPWIGPYPDRLLDEIAPPDDEPDKVVVARRSIELAFLAAVQLLPPRQRAVLIPPRCPRLVGARDGGPARDVGRGGQQRAAAGPGDDGREPAPRPDRRRPSPRPRPRWTWFVGRSRPTKPTTPRRWPRCSATTSGSRCRPRRSGSTARRRSCRPPGRPRRCRRMAPRADPRQPDAGDGQLPEGTGRHGVPRLQDRCGPVRGRASSPRSRRSARRSSRSSGCRAGRPERTRSSDDGRQAHRATAPAFGSAATPIAVRAGGAP